VRGYYVKQLDLVGTMMGSPLDFRAMLRACEAQSWTPLVDSARPLAQAAEALARKAANEHFGKLVLTL
jgi:zinc-binding alcohol dehydrogenase/oxidoreductase